MSLKCHLVCGTHGGGQQVCVLCLVRPPPLVPRAVAHPQQAASRVAMPSPLRHLRPSLYSTSRPFPSLSSAASSCGDIMLSQVGLKLCWIREWHFLCKRNCSPFTHPPSSLRMVCGRQGLFSSGLRSHSRNAVITA